MRKIRRDLLDNLNRERRDRGLNPFYLELMTDKIADYYAQFLLTNSHDQKVWEST